MMLSINFTLKARAEQAPSLEFLEFLGQGVQVEGEYLDPVNYQDIDGLVASEKSESDTANSATNNKEQTDE